MLDSRCGPFNNTQSKVMLYQQFHSSYISDVYVAVTTHVTSVMKVGMACVVYVYQCILRFWLKTNFQFWLKASFEKLEYHTHTFYTRHHTCTVLAHKRQFEHRLPGIHRTLHKN